MDLSSNLPATNAAAGAAAKSVEGQEKETPGRVQAALKPLSFSSNGVLKRHNSLHRHHAVVGVYKECLKNHAATLGGHAVDGCGEFLPSPSATPADPTSLKCAACGCHRNFHRRELEETLQIQSAGPAMDYQPHHRHHPPPPPPLDNSSPNSPSPPPISSSYYPSAPQMLLALSTGLSTGHPMESNTPISAAAPTAVHPPSAVPAANLNSRKRFRTKFTQDQKERMLEFAAGVGWRFQKRDEDAINNFCREIGVERGVLKVWMHNNKNTVGKRDVSAAAAAANEHGFDIRGMNCHNLDSGPHSRFNLRQESNSDSQDHYGLHNSDGLAANGSSSSS